MGAECTQADRQETKSGGNPEKGNGHGLNRLWRFAPFSSFSAEKFTKRLKDTAWKCSGFLSEILQFLRELGLRSAVNFTNGLRDLVVGQGDFIRGPGRVAPSRGEMVRDGTNRRAS